MIYPAWWWVAMLGAVVIGGVPMGYVLGMAVNEKLTPLMGLPIAALLMCGMLLGGGLAFGERP